MGGAGGTRAGRRATGVDVRHGPGRGRALAAAPRPAARAVCDQLPQHVLLVGAGAERFADETGIERGPTLTDEARQMWRDGLDPSALRRPPATARAR